MSGPAVPRDHGVIRHDVGHARAKNAARVRGAARRAELLDERGAGPRRCGRGRVEPRQGVDEAEGIFEVASAYEVAEAFGGGGGGDGAARGGRGSGG